MAGGVAAVGLIQAERPIKHEGARFVRQAPAAESPLNFALRGLNSADWPAPSSIPALIGSRDKTPSPRRQMGATPASLPRK
jgi:hypothetical protein